MKSTQLTRKVRNTGRCNSSFRRGSIFVEYVLLLTIVGIGVLVGLACIRTALVNELIDLATAIESLNC